MRTAPKPSYLDCGNNGGGVQQSRRDCESGPPARSAAELLEIPRSGVSVHHVAWVGWSIATIVDGALYCVNDVAGDVTQRTQRDHAECSNATETDRVLNHALTFFRTFHQFAFLLRYFLATHINGVELIHNRDLPVRESESIRFSLGDNHSQLADEEEDTL